MSLQVNIDGRPVNAVLTPAQLEQARKDEDNTFIVDQAIREQDTGYQHLGEFAPRRDNEGNLSIMATEDHLKPDLMASKQRRALNKPVIPVWYIEDDYGETHWFLNYDDAQMGLHGYLCFDPDTGTGCLAWQKDSDTKTCDPISGPPCGRRRYQI